MKLDEIRGTNLYLDSNVFIYALEGAQDDAHRASSQLLRELRVQHRMAVTSIISRSEVMVWPLRLKQVALADQYRALLSSASPIVVCPVDADIADRAAELRADYPALKLPDALHIATALRVSCDAFVTADKRLRAVSARITVLSLDQLSSD